MIPFQPHPASILFTWSPNQPGLAAHWLGWLGWLGRLGLTWTLPVILLLVAGDLSGSLLLHPNFRQWNGWMLRIAVKEPDR